VIVVSIIVEINDGSPSFISIVVEISPRRQAHEKRGPPQSARSLPPPQRSPGAASSSVGKSALGTVNAFPLSTIRYAVASLLWLAVLAVVEGRRSLSPAGHGLRLFWLGSLGFRRLQPPCLHGAGSRAPAERLAHRRPSRRF